ncbi:hypothetical protein Adt_45688 [Abeliophyllum distichum]|uniref:Uncharacterized protein n=1 Tax=Abeliophyllum distichum TaxID=126358 RepID=A0ABD1PEF6_9LAMI
MHLTSLQLNNRVFDLLKLEVNIVRPTDAEKEEAYTDGFFVNYKSQGQDTDDDDDFEPPVIHQLKLLIVAQELSFGNGSFSKLEQEKTVETICASLFKTCGIDVNDEVELKDED